MALFKKKNPDPPKPPEPVNVYYTVLRTEGDEARITSIRAFAYKNQWLNRWAYVPAFAEPGEFNEYIRGQGHAQIDGGGKNGCKIVQIKANDSFGVTSSSVSTYIDGIVIPDTVREIGSHAFMYTNTKILVPDSLIAIGPEAFISKSDKNVRSSLGANYYEGAYYLGNDQNPYVVLLRVDYSSTSCTVHPNTKIIHDNAFHEWTNGNRLLIPAAVRFIGESGNMRNITVSFEDPYGWWTLHTGGYTRFINSKIDRADCTYTCGMCKK